jgi:predicted unusual protein kinase regulating ubiquinone biosynthesis (AarF/ABC1/UbiB family)
MILGNVLTMTYMTGTRSSHVTEYTSNNNNINKFMPCSSDATWKTGGAAQC